MGPAAGWSRGGCGCVLVLALGTALVFWGGSLRSAGEPDAPSSRRPLALLKGAALFLGRATLFADMAVLLPFVKGRKGLGFAAWAGGNSLLVGVPAGAAGRVPGALSPPHPAVPGVRPGL